MSLADLSAEVARFVKSSAYQFGDRTGFCINLAEGVILPGKCSPSSYLDGLGLDKLPEKVMVICSGNGGLAVECFARGAKTVVAVEPRSRYNQGVQGVKRLLDTLWRLEKKHDRALLWHPHWLKVGKDQGFKDFDLILWPEGVEEVTTPKETFQAVVDCLAPGGRLMVELTHGTHQWVDKINSWRPTGHAVNEMAEALFGGRPTKSNGRSATSKIYTLTLPGKKKAEKKAEPKSKKEPGKKPAPKPKVEEKKTAPEPKPEPKTEEAPVRKPEAPLPPPPAKVEIKDSEPKEEPKLDAEAPRHVHVDLAKEKPVEAEKPVEEKPKASKKKKKRSKKPKSDG